VTGLDSIGTNATDVPVEAKVIDNTDPAVIYSPGWFNVQGVEYYNQSASATTTSGSLFTFAFEGTGIWYAEPSTA
jgi:hypothetical protein